MTALAPAPTSETSPASILDLPVRTPDLGHLSPADRTLLCVADALVLKVLEKAGKRILKEDRKRYGLHRGKPMWTVHTVWPTDEGTARKITRGEWTAFPHVLDAPELTRVEGVLDSYTVGILVQGTPHTPLALWNYLTEETSWQ